MACTSKWRNFSSGACAILMIAPFSMAAEATAIVDSHVRCLLGGASAKAWSADAPVSTHGAFRVVGPEGRSTPVRLGKIESAGEACEGTRTAAVHPAPPEGKPYVVMSGDWDPQPRPVEDIFSNKNRYSAAIRQFLATKGIEEQGEIRQILRADLDGDGNAEVIAVIRNPDSFAAVLVRRQEKGRVQTLIADLETSEDDLSEHNIAMIADLNGDGVMEIVVYGEYKQGVFTTVYTLEGSGVRKVLSCACGG